MATKKQNEAVKEIGDYRYGDEETFVHAVDTLTDAVMRKNALWETNPVLVTAAALDLNVPVVKLTNVTLRANLPSTIMLQGASDLLFSSFAVVITARTLDRNMASGAWGSASSVIEGNSSAEEPDYMEFVFPGLTALNLVAARSTKLKLDVPFTPKENGGYAGRSFEVPVRTYTTKEGAGSKQVALRTDAVRFALSAGAETAYLLRSPSLPSRVGIAIGDDSPVQVFPAEMADGGTLTSRELAGQVNGAWKQAKAANGVVAVPLKLTSMTDGAVDIEIKGIWGRSWLGPDTTVVPDAVNPQPIAAEWPFKQQSAAVSVRLTGRLSGGIRLNLVPDGGQNEVPFAVRVGEKLEAAQAILLAAGQDTGHARQASAVWLLLPALPKAEQKVELRLAKAVGTPPVPSDDPLARVVATLPADEAAYIKEKRGYWFRAAFDAPVALDGAQIVQPVFVMAAGRGDGTLLSHQKAADQPSEGGEADRIPGSAREAGPALVRNLARSGSWEVQRFNRQLSQWVMDLELIPLAAEYGSAATLAVNHLPGQDRQAVFAGPSAGSVDIQWADIAPPSTGPLAFALRSAIQGSFKAQIAFYRPVKQQ